MALAASKQVIWRGLQYTEAAVIVDTAGGVRAAAEDDGTALELICLP